MTDIEWKSVEPAHVDHAPKVYTAEEYERTIRRMLIWARKPDQFVRPIGEVLANLAKSVGVSIDD